MLNRPREDKFGRADLLVKELIERQVERVGCQTPIGPVLLALYGKYKKPIGNLVANIFGPVDIQHPLFQPPKKRRTRSKPAKAVTHGY